MALGPDGTGVVKGYHIGPGANLGGADLYGANLRGADLRGANLCGARLAAADLRKANLAGADLNMADLYGADLTRADFTGSNLKRANLNGSKVLRVNFSGANLETVELAGLHIVVSKLNGATLIGSDLKDTVFSRSDFTEANLEGAVLNTVRFFGCNLKKLKAKNSIIVNCALVTSDLRGASIDGAKFKNTHFMRAKLDRIDFRSCILISLKFTGSSLKRSNLSGVNLAGGVFTSANMQKANLSGANLTGADFEGADLTSANLTNTILKNADLTGTVLTGAKLGGANLRGVITPQPPIAAKSYGFMTGPILKMSRPGSPARAPEFKKTYPAEFERLKADMGGRDFNENIKTTIRDKYLTPFNWVVTRKLWKDKTQRVSKKPNLVMLLSINTESVDFTEHQAGLLKALSKAVYFGTQHPHEQEPMLTVGWVRYAKYPRHKVILIEEVQNDLNSSNLKRTSKSGYALNNGSINEEQFWEAAGLIRSYEKRFYEDAIGLIYEEAAALGYTVEMLGYEDKLPYCYEDDFGAERCPPKPVYTDLPKRMGMLQKRDSEVPVRKKLLGKVSYYKPNPGIPPRYRTECCCICSEPASLLSERGEAFCEDCF